MDLNVGIHPRGDHFSGERARGAGADAAIEDQGDLLGMADIEVAANDGVEPGSPVPGPVEHGGVGELDWRNEYSQPYPASVSQAWNGPGRHDSHRAIELPHAGPTSDLPIPGRRRVSQDSRPLSSGTKPTPVSARRRFSHSWPFKHPHTGKGTKGHILMNAGPHWASGPSRNERTSAFALGRL